MVFLPEASAYAFLVCFTVLSRAIDIERALHPLEYRQNNVPVVTAPGGISITTTSTSASIAATVQKSNIPTAASTTASDNTPTTDASPTTSTNGFTVDSTQALGQTTLVSVTDSQTQSSFQSVESKPSVSFNTNSQSASSTTASSKTGSVTAQFLTTVVLVSGSSTVSSVKTTSSVVDAAAATSGAPGLVGTSGGSGSPGISSSSKKVIGGVVGGVGGAILLGGIAIVVWRIWGRKRQSGYNDDDPNSPAGSSGREKRSSISGQSPFQSNLDQYHSAAPVNTASNF